jgi:hypothetical protein
MSIWSKNKHLWRDVKSYETYLKETDKLVYALSKENFVSNDFLNIANNLDELFQSYEKNFGPIEDPMFFFTFAQANAIFLQVGKKYDELGATRLAYIVNGFKEGLTKHLLYPTFDEMVMQSIDDTFMQFANDYDKNWFTQNRNKFYPVT